MAADDFRIYCPLEAFEKSGEENPMRVGGIVSTDELDRQGERIVQEGLDFGDFLGTGWFNDNHGGKSTDILGYPTHAKLVKKGEILPNGKSSKTNGWWAEGYLLDTAEGRKVWGLSQALSKTPRKLGFSIEGKVGRRSDKDDSVILSARVRNVAITHCPVNVGTELQALAKALSAGYPSHNIPGSTAGGTPGDGAPLRALVEPEGPGGLTAIRHVVLSPDAEGGPLVELDGDLSKAGDIDLGGISEADHFGYWADATAAFLRRQTNPELTKGEARAAVAARRPDLPAAVIDRIVDDAATSRSPQ